MSILDEFEEGEVKEETELARKINTAYGRLFTSLHEVADYLGVDGASYYQMPYSPDRVMEPRPTTTVWQATDKLEPVGYVCNTCDGIRLGVLPVSRRKDDEEVERNCFGCNEAIGTFADKEYKLHNGKK